MENKLIISIDLETKKVTIEGGNQIEKDTESLLSALNILSRVILGVVVKCSEANNSLKKDLITFKDNFVFILQNLKL
jgi:hypothetical protein